MGLLYTNKLLKTKDGGFVLNYVVAIILTGKKNS